MGYTTYSRRDFGKVALGGAALATGLALGATVRAAGVAPKVRRNINDLNFGPDATAQYREAVAALRALDPADPRHWLNLSAIHRNHCPHGNWYFLPWHRAFLSAFEGICREVTHNADFALPYWDWSSFRQLPAGFVDVQVDSTDNPLFHEERDMKGSDTLTTMLAPFGVDAEAIFGFANITTIMAAKTFQEFGSTKPRRQVDLDSQWQRASGRKTALEFGPHDFLHGAVGKDMGNPNISPQDPIFYLHHCNLDRLWALWNDHGGPNEADALWQDFTYRANFPHPDGAAGDDIVVKSLLDIEALGYTYTDAPPVRASALALGPDFDRAAFPPQMWEENVPTGQVTQLALDPNPELAVRVQTTLREPERDGRIYLVLNDVTAPRDTRTNVRVFLNCDYLTPLTPVDDPHHAANFTFFTADHEHGQHDMGADASHGTTQNLAIDITETARAVAATGGRIEDELIVQLLPLSFDGTPTEDNGFSVGSIEVATI